jgi:AsmA-like C-terminal region/AsmA family
VKLFSSRKLAVAAAVLLCSLILLRPGVSRLKTRIANSISRAIARPVEIGSVHLRFLPPGFDLRNVTVYEDPAFGAEPMLRAPEVTAVVRFTSLLRGRLDISRLELTEPSLNLVRIGTGRWNLEALLERSAHTPLAPTAKSKSEPRPGFPYIEATGGRINFKAGPEKKPYALLNSDFALWQDSENTWGLRLKAEPMRTDMSLNNVGLLRVNGIWQRASNLHETPLQFSIGWERAQLGQFSKFLAGTDKGWRGELRSEATLKGTPGNLQVSVDAAVRNFHRYDVASSDEFRLAAHCDGKYKSAEAMMHEILCSAPVGNGMVTLRGDAGLPRVHKLDLRLNVESVPMSALEHLARHTKKDLPMDLTTSGSIQGAFSMKGAGGSETRDLRGRGQIIDLQMQSANTKSEIAVERIPFTLSSGPSHDHSFSVSVGKFGRSPERDMLPAPDAIRVEYGPFPVALGRLAPAQAWGWFTRSGYAMLVRGDGEVSHTLRIASLLGLPAVKANIQGAAQMELQIGGSWTQNVSESASGTFLPAVTGTVQLHNLRATIRGTKTPLEILSAEVRLQPKEVRVEKLNLLAAHSRWIGSLALPRGCGVPGACLVHFNLSTEEAGLGDIYGWLSEPPTERRWYQMLSSTESLTPAFLESLRASGTMSVGRLLLHKVVASDVFATLDLERGKLKMSNVRADLLGGRHNGDWQADFTASPPLYAGSGTLTSMSLEKASDAMHDQWVSGAASGEYQVTASGTDSAAFWSSLEGGVKFDLRNGILFHISLAGAEDPLQVARWQGDLHLKDGVIEIQKGRLLTRGAAYDISGTASFNQALDLKLSKDFEVKSPHAASPIFSITGTVAEPRVVLTPAAETEAELKP